jgi:hypothetical protein
MVSSAFQQLSEVLQDFLEVLELTQVENEQPTKRSMSEKCMWTRKPVDKVSFS